MLTKHLDVTFLIMWSLTLAHIIGGAICLAASGAFARLALVPAGKLVPIVLALMFLSAFQGSQSWGDLYSLVIFGAVGWVMKQFHWPRPPLMLGFVLGAVFERNYFISTEIYGWHWLLRPGVLVILAVTLWIVARPLRDNAVDIVRTFRRNHGIRARFTSAAAFNLLILIVTAAALWQASEWPWQAKLVPESAIYIVLAAATLNLVIEVFFAGSGREEPAHGMDSRIAAPVPLAASLRHFAWMVSFLVAAYGIGLLPALFLLILLHSRLEFRQRWQTAIISAVLVTGLSWLVFDRIFAVVWPPSLIGNLVSGIGPNFAFG